MLEPGESLLDYIKRSHRMEKTPEERYRDGLYAIPPKGCDDEATCPLYLRLERYGVDRCEFVDDNGKVCGNKKKPKV